jgi:hypothetical protein
MTTTLGQQIAELTALHNFKSEMDTLLGQYKIMTYKSTGKAQDHAISIDLKGYAFPELLSNYLTDITTNLKPTETTYKFSNGDKLNQSPFYFSWENSVNENHVLISYISNRINVRIEIPVSFYKNVYRISSRKVYESEHVFFLGESRKAISDYRLRAYSCLYFENMGFYGGNYVTWIPDAEYREQYERMIFTGEQPLG